MAASALPEYTATEARKHIGETATVVGKIDCIEHGRRHTDLEMGACLPNTLLMVVVPDDLAGLKLDPGQLRGATIAVTGKIESSGGMPQITIKSTKQIVPRTPVGPDYLSTAMEKQSRGDLDGAIADLDRAIEQAHEPGMYVQRAEAKMMKGDLDGAIHDYDELIGRHPPGAGAHYLSRARLKFKKSDYGGAIADCDAAIAGMPEQRDSMMRAQAYDARGDAKEAKGDFAGAAADYQMALGIIPSGTIYKTKLKHAQAEAKKSKGEPDGESAAYQLPAGDNPMHKASNSEEKELEAARAEYDQVVPADGEAARLRYVTRLAEIYYRFLKNYWATGDKSANYATLVNAELKKHPAPKDSDAKKLSKLLVGKWQSPRHIYVFRANGKYGNEDGPISSNWRIQGNQLIEDGSRGTIILLSSDYFIYAEKDAVFFHSRVGE